MADMFIETYVAKQLLRMMNSAIEILLLMNVTMIGNFLLKFLHLWVGNDVSLPYNVAQYDQNLGIENIVLI